MYTHDDPKPSSKTWRVIALYVACYVLWGVTSAIGMWLIFLIRRNLVEDIFFMRVNAWQLSAIDRWSVFVMGIVWVTSIFLIEGYLRTAVEQGKLWRRAGRVLVVQLLLVGTSLLVSQL